MGIFKKIDLQKVVAIASCVLAGVTAFAGAVSEQKQAAKIVELETRLSNLESK